MKIVQFQNGRYAVRKGNWLTMYLFAAPDKSAPSGWYWWTPKYADKASMDTLAEAVERLNLLRQLKAKAAYDCGVPISYALGEKSK